MFKQTLFQESSVVILLVQMMRSERKIASKFIFTLNEKQKAELMKSNVPTVRKMKYPGPRCLVDTAQFSDELFVACN